LPELDKLARQYGGRVSFLAVSLNGDRRRIRVSAEELHLHLPLAAAESELLGPLGLETVPATFLVDANGLMVSRIDGVATADQLARKLDALLASAPISGR
jgi:hypothetical protein